MTCSILRDMDKSTGSTIRISEEQILKRMGLRQGRRPSLRVARCIKKSLEKIMITARPQALYRMLPIRTSGGFTCINGKDTLKSRKLSRILFMCDRAVVFVTTLGHELDMLIKSTMSERPHEGIILDIAASLAAESMANTLQQRMDNILGEHQFTTLRYSPGYCDWPLKEQEKLFHLLSADSIGVSLSENYLMTPRKSVSGIMGIGPSEVVQKFGNACKECLNVKCENRRS